MHGRPWRGENVAGWLASEKLDGCRGYWDGERMWSRSGRTFPIPPTWSAKLPSMHLDGEIWAGRGKWELTVEAVVRGKWDAAVCFMIFDAPQVSGTWDQRIAAVAKRVRCSFAAAVPWQRIETMDHLSEVFRRVGEGGGEGLMLRCPAAVGYSASRSNRVLKLTRDPISRFIPPGRIVVERRMRLARRAA